MGDNNFRPALNQGFAYDGAILKGAHTRRRLAMGRDAALESEPDEERDPEGPVTDYDELVRYLSLRGGQFVTCLSPGTAHAGADLISPRTIL